MLTYKKDGAAPFIIKYSNSIKKVWNKLHDAEISKEVDKLVEQIDSAK